MVNLSVNQTRSHSSHKWPLVFSTVGLCGNDLRSQILDGFLLCGSVNLSPVLTLFFGPNLPGQTWAALWASPKFIRISQEGYTIPFRKRQVARQEKWLSTLNNSYGISGTTLTLPQPEEWITSRCLLPHPIQPTRKYQSFLIQGLPCQFKYSRLVCFHSTQVLQETGDSSPTHSCFNHVLSRDTLHRDAISS